MSLRERLVKYEDLVPCRNAFIDTRSPGSERKENFTVIGPGVAENPEQHVHIRLPHGFNIGGARQPPGCLNSQHSHLTAEVFLVHSGTWAFRSGVDARDGEVVMREGDVISLPTDVFRGFENVGTDVGYLYAILGGDDPGRVLWAPQVFDLAASHGLVLLEDGSLVDTTKGQAVPAGKRPMPRTTAAQIAAHRIVNSSHLRAIVIRRDDYDWRTDTALSRHPGVEEAALLGPASPAEAVPAGRLEDPLGFAFRALRLGPGAAVPAHRRAEEEVIFVLCGRLQIEVDGQSLELARGDTFTTPVGVRRSFREAGGDVCTLYVTRRGDQPTAPVFD